MGKLTVKTGSTSRLEHVFILDSTSTTGAGKTGLTDASVTMSFFRPADTTVTLVTLSAGTLGTWTTGGFKEINATDMPGVYEIGMPNAVFAATFNHSVVMVKGTGIAPVVLEYNLVSYDPLDTVRLGLTALPNVVSGVAGAIITSGTGTAQLTTATGQVTVATNNDKTAYSLSGTQTFNMTGNVTGNLTGSVGSIASGGITSASFAAGAIDASAIASDAITSAELATSAIDEIADGILNRNIAGGSSTGRLVKDAFRAIRNKSAIASGTLTVYQEDDTTSAWTATVVSDAAANPIISIDPA